MKFMSRSTGKGIQAVRLSLSLAGLAMALSLQAANAAGPPESGFYLGVHYGQSEFDSPTPSERAGKIYSVDSTRHWSDQSSQALTLDLGYQITKYFAIETSYWDLGDGRFNEDKQFFQTGPGLYAREQYIDNTMTAKGFTAGVVASLPWRSLRLSAKLDAFRHEITLIGTGTRTTVPSPFGPPTTPVTTSVQFNDSSSDTKLFYGASISYTIATHFRAEVEWREARHLGNQSDHGGINLNVLSLGFQYHF